MNPTLVRVWLRHSHTHIVRIHSAVRRLHCQGSFAVVVPCALPPLADCPLCECLPTCLGAKYNEGRAQSPWSLAMTLASRQRGIVGGQLTGFCARCFCTINAECCGKDHKCRFARAFAQSQRSCVLSCFGGRLCMLRYMLRCNRHKTLRHKTRMYRREIITKSFNKWN